MFPHLQPQRPQLQQSKLPLPLHQQQTRNLHAEPQLIKDLPAPRNQIEAMPPVKDIPMPDRFKSVPMPDLIKPTPMPEILRDTPIPMQPMYNNPAVMHPVFMGNFRKAPFPLAPNVALNPVATGYIFARDRVNGNTKL